MSKEQVVIVFILIILVILSCLWERYTRRIRQPDKKIEHISPLCKVLDEAKYVFGDDKNIDIDEICQYIRNAYIAESEVQE